MNDVFKQNPNLEKYFSTSDGEAFYNQNDAKNHAKTLDAKTVETVYNETFLDVIDAEDLSPEAIEMAEFEKSEAEAKLQVVTEETEKVEAVPETPEVVTEDIEKAEIVTETPEVVTEETEKVEEVTETTEVLTEDIEKVEAVTETPEVVTEETEKVEEVKEPAKKTTAKKA